MCSIRSTVRQRPGAFRSARGVVAALALLLAAACGPTPLSTPVPAASALPDDRIQLLHTDDIHGHLDSEAVSIGSGSFRQGGMATLAAQVAQLRAAAPARTLLLDAGDAWQGTFISNANKGEAVTKAMSLMRYDAMALGNHDFDWGQDVLAERAKEAGFPSLAANVLVSATGQLPPYVRPYVVKDLGIARVAVIGITNPDSATIVKATSVTGLRFLPAADGVRRYLAEAQRQADVIVVAAHIGSQDAARLARDVPGIDVVVAGHDHQPLRTARLEGSTTVVDAGAYTQYFGRLEIVIDRATHKLKDAARGNELVAIASGAIAPDSQIVQLVAARRAEANKYTSRVVGRARSDLDNPREECGLGNLITDAMVEYGRTQGWKSDVAFYNMAGVRAPLRAGDVTYGKLYEVLPFDDIVVNVDLTGEQLRAVLEAASGTAGRVHIGGGSWAYRGANPAGQRVLAATIAGQPLDPTRVYHVATIDYLLLGGDGHTEFARGTNVIYGDVDVDVVAAYLAAHSPVDPKVEGRIQQR